MQFTEKELNHIYLCVLADMVNGDRFGEEAKTDMAILKKINDSIDGNETKPASQLEEI